MQDKISQAIDDNEFSLGIFFDLAKDFDKVDHCILLKKLIESLLKICGIHDIPLCWFNSYLDHRQQLIYVMVSCPKSNLFDMKSFRALT